MTRGYLYRILTPGPVDFRLYTPPGSFFVEDQIMTDTGEALIIALAVVAVGGLVAVFYLLWLIL
jgi:hypothetical protein